MHNMHILLVTVDKYGGIVIPIKHIPTDTRRTTKLEMLDLLFICFINLNCRIHPTAAQFHDVKGIVIFVHSFERWV